MKKKLLITAGTGLVVLLISGALIGVALAADPTPTPKGNGARQQTFIAKLAKILGIQEQQLTDAVKKTNTEMVDEAVQAGKLTQEQANSLKERIDKGNGSFGPMLGGPGGHRGPGGPGFGKGFGPGFGHDMTDVANFLGITLEDLTSELRHGKTTAQVGEAHGKTRDQLKSAIVVSIQKNVYQAASDGKLTKEKADEILKDASAQVDKMLDASDAWESLRPSRATRR